MRRGPHRLELDQQIGQAVLDGLKAPDGPAELHALLGVFDGDLEQQRRPRRRTRPPAARWPATRSAPPPPNRPAARRRPRRRPPRSGPRRSAGSGRARSAPARTGRSWAGAPGGCAASSSGSDGRHQQEGGVVGGVDVAGDAVEAPPVTVPARPAPRRRRVRASRRRSGTRRPSPRPRRCEAGAPCAGPRFRSAAMASATTLQGTKGPGFSVATELLGQDDEVDQRLLGDAAPFVLRRDQHGRPAELGTLVARGLRRRPRARPGSDARRPATGGRRGNDASSTRSSSWSSPNPKSIASGPLPRPAGPPSHVALGRGPVLFAQEALVELATVGARQLRRGSRRSAGTCSGAIRSWQ